MTTIHLEPHPYGIILPVRAQPGARRSGIVGIQDGALKVAVAQAPEKGKANNAVAAVLAEELKLKKISVELASGETSRRKRFLLRGVNAEDVEADRIYALSEHSGTAPGTDASCNDNS